MEFIDVPATERLSQLPQTQQDSLNHLFLSNIHVQVRETIQRLPTRACILRLRSSASVRANRAFGALKARPSHTGWLQTPSSTTEECQLLRGELADCARGAASEGVHCNEHCHDSELSNAHLSLQESRY